MPGLSEREKRRIQTTKQKHGSNIFREGGRKGGQVTWANIRKRLGEQK